MSRRLLLLNYFYPPLGGGGVHRVLGFTRHLPALGWSCTVVCAGPEDYWVRDDTLAIPAGTEVIRVPGGSGLSAWLKLRRGAGAGRRSGATFATLRRLSDWWLIPDSYVGWAARARAAAARRIARGDIDALLSSSPPDSTHLAAAAVARTHRLPWVVDFRDPWIGLHFRTPPTAWHHARQAAMERRVIEGADLVLVASHTHGEQLRAAFPAAASKIHELPNGFEPGLPRHGESAGPDPDHFTLVYTGTVSEMPDALLLLEALHEVLGRRPEARRRIRMKFAGPYDVAVEDRGVALGLKGIAEFLGPVPHDTARALQHQADLLVLFKPSAPGYRTMVPGKLYEYLDSGRPLLAILDPGDEAAHLAERGGAVVVPRSDRARLANVIEERYQAWRESGPASDRRPEWLDGHARSRLVARLAEMLAARVRS